MGSKYYLHLFIINQFQFQANESQKSATDSKQQIAMRHAISNLQSLFFPTDNVTTGNFYTEIFINSMPDKVWDILFSPNGFFKSFLGTEIHSTLKVGDTIEFVTIDNNIRTVHIYGNIKACDKHKLLYYTEHPGAIYAENHKDLQSDTKITFDQAGNTTRLILLCDNFTDKTLNDKSNQWYLILSNLKTFIETGQLLNLK